MPFRRCPTIAILCAGCALLAAPLDLAAGESKRGGTLQTITVGSGTDCDYADLQDAINAAADNTEIRLEAGPFSGNFSIFGKDLVLHGGYLECADATAGGGSTLDASGSGRPLLIGSSSTPSEVTLRNLFIEGGNVPGNGGGIEIDGSDADHEVTLDDVTVRYNSAEGNGGGVHMSGGSNMRLSLRGSTTILGNDAGVAGSNGGGEGGGVFCRGIGGLGLVRFEDGIVSLNSSENEGGGFSLKGCNLVMEPAADVAFNSAGSVGGGISVVEDSALTIDGGGSNSVAGNSAAGDGGGVFAADSATIDLVAAVVSDNSAEAGGGIYVRDNASVVMSGGGSSACTGAHCSILSDNSADAGGALLMFGGAAVITGTRIEGNSGTQRGSVAQLGGGASLRIESSIVYENAGLELFRLSIDGELEIAWSTVADNSADSGSPEIIRLTPDDVETTSLRLLSSIFRNAGRDVLLLNDDLGSNYASQFDCLISNELASLSGSTRSFVDEPAFIDSAADDYHLQSTSPAIDACDDASPPTVADIDGDPRGWDFGAASPQDYDIGADEVHTGIFADRFEG